LLAAANSISAGGPWSQRLLRRLPGAEGEQQGLPAIVGGKRRRLGRGASQPRGGQPIEQPVGVVRLLGDSHAEFVERRAVVGHAHRHAGARRRAGLRQQLELVAPVVVGFGQPAQRRARDAAGIQRIAILRIGGQHAVEDLDRLLVAAERRQRLALQRQHLDKLGIHLQRALVAVQRLRRAATGETCVAVRDLRQDLAADVGADQVVGFGLEGEVALAAIDVAPIGGARRQFRPQAARPLVLAMRLVAASQAIEDLRPCHHGIGEIGNQCQRPVERRERAFAVAATPLDQAVAEMRARVVLVVADLGANLDRGRPAPQAPDGCDGRS